MKKVLSFLILSSLLLGLAHCGGLSSGSRVGKVKYPNAVNPTWKAEFSDAERDFEARNYNRAERIYRAYIQKYPYNELTDRSQFRLGQIAMLRQNYPQAIQIFQGLARKTPDFSIKSKANSKLGISYYRQSRWLDALNAFNVIDANLLEDREKARMGSLAISASQNLREDLNRRAYYYAVLYDLYELLTDREVASRYGKDGVSKAEAGSKLKEWAESSTPFDRIDRRLLEYQGRASAPFVDFKLGKSAFEAKDSKKAKEFLKRYVSKNPNHTYVSQANQMLVSLGSSISSKERAESGNVIKVGVILPLSGKFEQYGNKTLKGMECAASVKPECQGVKNIELVVKDSSGDPAKASLLIDELVNKDKVVVILGPLTSAEVDAAAKEAQTQGVVLLSLAQKKGIPQLGENIFRFGLTYPMQAESLIQHVSQKRNIKSLAILYPNNNYGQDFLAEFERAAAGSGVQLTSKTSYNPGKEDLSQEVRQLKINVTQVNASGKGFEAVFIPDSYLNAGKAAIALSKLDIANLLVLGTNAWNDPSLPSRLAPHVQNAMFVDVFFQDSTHPQVQNFVQQFKSAYNYSPSALEAMGYDSVKILSEILSKTKNPKRGEIRDLLLQTHNFQGVTGLRGFRSDREAEIQPYLIQVDSAGMKEIQK